MITNNDENNIKWDTCIAQEIKNKKYKKYKVRFERLKNRINIRHKTVIGVNISETNWLDAHETPVNNDKTNMVIKNLTLNLSLNNCLNKR